MTFLIDANVLVKTIVQEAQSAEAEVFVGRWWTQLAAPDLLLVEVAGTMVRLVNDRKLERAKAVAAFTGLRAWNDIGIRLHRVTPQLIEAAGIIAIEMGHPIKDCIYLALADELGCPLVTCDVKFRNRVANPARVQLLAEVD